MSKRKVTKKLKQLTLYCVGDPKDGPLYVAAYSIAEAAQLATAADEEQGEPASIVKMGDVFGNSGLLIQGVQEELS